MTLQSVSPLLARAIVFIQLTPHFPLHLPRASSVPDLCLLNMGVLSFKLRHGNLPIQPLFGISLQALALSRPNHIHIFCDCA